MTDYLTTPEGRRLAINRASGAGPAVLFLGGFRSDMTGTKAMFLEDWCWSRGRAFVRFDYSGHGASDGAFEDGCIGDWAADAAAVLATIEGPAVLVGSSMGGWISLILARAMPERIAGLVTIAAAPDFTEDLFWAGLPEARRREVMDRGVLLVPSAYGDPCPYTRRLVEDGRRRLVLRDPLDLPFPVRLLQGTADAEVPQEVALRLLAHATGPDIRLVLVKGADHRFSDAACLDLIAQAVAEVAPT
ncbi:MAG: alpha/beta fold hydrolase [Rubellimicrobium sp.]|nr:alpha/beta fold hydrolase [Rubellimicrobium sp.]